MRSAPAGAPEATPPPAVMARRNPAATPIAINARSSHGNESPANPSPSTIAEEVTSPGSADHPAGARGSRSSGATPRPAAHPATASAPAQPSAARVRPHSAGDPGTSTGTGTGGAG